MLEGVSQCRGREYVCVTKTTGRKTDRDIVIGKREEEEGGRRPGNSHEGNVHRWEG